MTMRIAFRQLITVVFILLVLNTQSFAEQFRHAVELSSGWRFHQGDVTNLSLTTPDTTGWDEVSVPHTWNRVGHYIVKPETRIHQKGNINNYQGIAWYALEFSAPVDSDKQQAWLQFDAASRTAKVWLNGTLLGEHRGGFSRFRFDATSAIKFGETNQLLVKVDNSKPAGGGSTADTLPLYGDFFIHGGLYRPVSLITTHAVHVDMMDSGGPGIYATTEAISQNKAEVSVVTRLKNDGEEALTITARTLLLDAKGNPVAEKSRAIKLAKAEATQFSTTLTVSNPHLWQGTADPYLHQLLVELVDRQGSVLDRVEQPFGIRQVRVDPDRGFLLNDKPLKLYGVSYHQDREGMGWSGSAQSIEEDFHIMREMGANSIRLAHYQHGQIIHELANKHGVILWDEIPLVTGWTLGKALEATPAFKANARQQLREMIRQNYNHPSVAVWGIANEVDFGNSMPYFLVGYEDGKIPNPMAILTELNALAKAEDPSRPTTLATCCEGRLFDAGVEVPEVAATVDLGGANRYFGWYYGSANDLGSNLDKLRAKRPMQPVSVTEYGAGSAITMHSDNPLGGAPDSRWRKQPEEYASYVHEQNWEDIASRPYLWGSWIWNAFDFATTIRREGDADDINTKGLVTYDRKVRKDAYYFYKANWTQEPMVYITGRRYVDRAYRVMPVRVYSNTQSTELFVNGKSMGILEHCPNRICVWPNITLGKGKNLVVAKGLGRDSDDSIATDSLEWNLGKDAYRSVRIDSGALLAGDAGARKFGSDTYFSGGISGTVDVQPHYGQLPRFPEVAGSTLRDIMASYREGTFSYRIPLENGSYKLSLNFMEPEAKVGERVFDVFGGHKKIVSGLDVAKEAGATLTAITREVSVQATDGALELKFVPQVGDAIVSSVEIEKQ